MPRNVCAPDALLQSADGCLSLGDRRPRRSTVALPHIIGDDLLEFLGDAFTLERNRFHPIDVDRSNWTFTRTG